MKKIFLISLIIPGFFHLDAQKRPAEGLWLSANAPVNLSSHWQWHNDAGFRTLGVSSKPLQYLYRTGARHNFNKQWSIASGIALFSSRSSFLKTNDEFGHEFRFWKEANHQEWLNKKMTGLMRFRVEQRFFAATNSKSKYTGYRFRFRPGLNQKLNEKWSLHLTDEYFRQISHHKFSFDQNRLTLSGIYQIAKTQQVQAGYMWLKWSKESQHILTLTFTKNIYLHGS